MKYQDLRQYFWPAQTMSQAFLIKQRNVEKLYRIYKNIFYHNC